PPEPNCGSPTASRSSASSTASSPLTPPPTPALGPCATCGSAALKACLPGTHLCLEPIFAWNHRRRRRHAFTHRRHLVVQRGGGGPQRHARRNWYGAGRPGGRRHIDAGHIGRHAMPAPELCATFGEHAAGSRNACETCPIAPILTAADRTRHGIRC